MSFVDQVETLRSKDIAPPPCHVTGRSGLRAGVTGWTLAQAVAHCAQSIECSITAYPQLRSGLFRATIGPIVKRKFIRAHRMKHDVLAPVAGAPDIPATVTLAEACDRAVAAWRAFDAFTGELAPHLAYGRCSKADYVQLHQLHFDDHLRSFGLA